jgi:phosphatidylserine/phosphatidylglycerophosphate/cardiolipin synthase-like enzyme
MAYLTRYGFKKLLRRLNKRHRVRILISEEDQNDSTLSYFVERWNVPAKIIENRKYNQEIYVDENGDERIRDNWQARMHHKFVLIKEIKKRIVWTGSYNITYPGLNLNDEAILRIEDPYVYKSYLKTFNMLWQPSKLKEIKLLQ